MDPRSQKLIPKWKQLNSLGPRVVFSLAETNGEVAASHIATYSISLASHGSSAPSTSASPTTWSQVLILMRTHLSPLGPRVWFLLLMLAVKLGRF